MQLIVKKLKNSLLGLAFILVLGVVSQAANAVVIERLYEGQVEVSDQTRKTRHMAFKQAFQQTLIRVVGSSTILGHPLIDEARNNVLKYITQFRYQELPAKAIDTSAPVKADAGEIATDILWIEFDQRAINNLLRQAQFPVWSKQRRETLVWIAVSDGGQRYILKNSDSSPIKDEIEKAAKLRGLPIRWPDYDELDSARLGFLDIWGGFWSSILKVSRRYQKESVLVGRYLWAGAEWQVRWDLLTAQHVKAWQINTPSLVLLSSEGIDEATDKISPRYALQLKESGGGNFYIDVHGIDSTQRYADVMKYLLALQPVKDINASEVSDQGVRFKIESQGDIDDLKRTIAMGSYLAPAITEVSTQQSAIDDVVLAYEVIH